ncbi:hypothetical protein [Enterococcus sp. DIV0187]|uniref:hypothetical protein n=1 Tax=Enterococcus sp. DIV0187 TaxID=2774644 RepID=UPI003F25FB77
MKKIIYLAGLLSVVLLLSSCSNNETKSAESTDTNKMTVSEYIKSNKKESKYMLISDDHEVDKDTSIDYVLAFDKDKATAYTINRGNGFTLGKIAKMSDEEIAKHLREIDEKQQKEMLALMQSSLDDYKESANKYFDGNDKYPELAKADTTRIATENYLSKIQASINEYKVKPLPSSKISLSIQTDGSGNHTESERITFDISAYRTDEIIPISIMPDSEIDDLVAKKAYEIVSTRSSHSESFSSGTTERWAEIYDANYNIIPTEQGFIAIRSKKQVELALDQPDTADSDIKIDE